MQILIHKADPDETGFWVECPDLGIASQGETIKEAVAMIIEAIELYEDDHKGRRSGLAPCPEAQGGLEVL